MLLAVAGVVSLGIGEAAAVATGGRVSLVAPTRMADVAGPISADVAVPSAAVLQITVTARNQPVEVYSHACGVAAAPPAVMVLAPGETASNTIVTGTGAACVSALGADRVAADQRGTVAATPSPSGLQYSPLATPIDVAPVAPVVGDAILLLSSAPAGAAGVVLDVRTVGAGAGYATLHPCGQSRSLASDAVVTTGVQRTLAYAALDPADNRRVCIFTSVPTLLRAIVVGFLADDGADPTRLPPTLTFGPGLVDPPGLVAGAPVRVLDTRETSTVEDPDTGELVDVPAVPVVGGKVHALDLNAYISADTRAAVLNVTVTEPSADGYLTVYPCDATERPTASNLNYVRGQTVANLVTVPVALDGTVCFYSQATTHLVVDLTGSFDQTGGAGAHAVTPARLLDTREPTGVPAIGKQPSGQVLTVQIAGRGGVPADAEAVTLNVTATEPAADGYLTVYPCDATERPTASNLNYVRGQTVPNAVTVALSAAGTVCLYSQSTTHLVADVAMWFGADEPAGFEELVPARLLDTRKPTGVPAIAPVPAGKVLTLAVSGRGGVPAGGAQAVVLNVTVTEPAAAGYLAVYPCDAAERPTASNLNYVRGQTVPNQVTVKLSASGTVCIFGQATAHVVADVAGYTTEVQEPGIVGVIG